MHSEWCDVPEHTVDLIRETQARGNKVIAVALQPAPLKVRLKLMAEKLARGRATHKSLFILGMSSVSWIV
jgi:S-adenosylmethionine:tRNA-ribosyltransferase-isomerase (queuine synthetase)